MQKKIIIDAASIGAFAIAIIMLSFTLSNYFLYAEDVKMQQTDTCHITGDCGGRVFLSEAYFRDFVAYLASTLIAISAGATLVVMGRRHNAVKDKPAKQDK